MKFFLIVVAVIVFFAGAAAGYKIAPQGSQAPMAVTGRNEAKKLMGSYPDVDFTACKAAPDEAQAPCAEQMLFTDAVSKKDAALCERLQSSGLKDNCKAVIARQKSLGQAADVFCQGLKTDALCLDLAQTLAAADNQNGDMCGSIVIDPVRALCSALTSKPGTDLSKQKTLKFGYVCNGLKADCDKERMAFVEAVKTNKPELCSSLSGINKDACVYEAFLYQAFTKKNADLCSKAPAFPGEEKASAANRCKIDLTFALALQSGDDKQCDKSVAAELVAACKQFVNTAAEKRFDYLTAAAK